MKDPNRVAGLPFSSWLGLIAAGLAASGAVVHYTRMDEINWVPVAFAIACLFSAFALARQPGSTRR